MEVYKTNSNNETILIMCHAKYRYINHYPNVDDFIRQKLMMNYNVVLWTLDTPLPSAQTIPNEWYSSIKERVNEYYRQHPFQYCIIIGNEREVPGYIDSAENAMTDNPYSIVDSLEMVEFIMGRISSGEGYDIIMEKNISVQIQKTIEYENIVGNNKWLNNVVTIGSDEGGVSKGDNNEIDYEHLHIIAKKFKNISYNVQGYYDGTQLDGGGNGLDGDKPGRVESHEISKAVNEGCGLVFYAGHAFEQSWLTSNFKNKDVYQLQNNDMYPMVITVGCSTGSFDEKFVSFKEAWQSAHNNKGPIGSVVTIGSTILQQWAPPMACQDHIVELLLRQINGSIKMTMGEMFHEGLDVMVAKYGYRGNYERLFWHFFGDPTVSFKGQLVDSPQPETLEIIRSYPQVNEFITPSLMDTIMIVMNKNLPSVATTPVSLVVDNNKSDTYSLLLTIVKQEPTSVSPNRVDGDDGSNEIQNSLSGTISIVKNIISLTFNHEELSKVQHSLAPRKINIDISDYVDSSEPMLFTFSLLSQSAANDASNDASIETSIIDKLNANVFMSTYTNKKPINTIPIDVDPLAGKDIDFYYDTVIKNNNNPPTVVYKGFYDTINYAVNDPNDPSGGAGDGAGDGDGDGAGDGDDVNNDSGNDGDDNADLKQKLKNALIILIQLVNIAYTQSLHGLKIITRLIFNVCRLLYTTIANTIGKK